MGGVENELIFEQPNSTCSLCKGNSLDANRSVLSCSFIEFGSFATYVANWKYMANHVVLL